MQHEVNPARTLTSSTEPVAQEPLSVLPMGVGFAAGIVLILVAALGSWRDRVRRGRAFQAAAAAPCRPNRWYAVD